MTGHQPTNDDRELDRWVQEVTDGWRMPRLRADQTSWRERTARPAARRWLPLPLAGRAAASLAGVAVVAVVALAVVASSSLLLGPTGGRQSGTPIAGGAVPSVSIAPESPFAPPLTDAPSPEPSGQPTPTPTSGPAPAGSAQDDLFELTIVSLRKVYAVDEPMSIATTLRYIGTQRSTVTSSGGGLVAFSIEQLDGPIDAGPARRSDCRQYDYAPGDVEEVPFQKSGGFSDDDPLADFWRAFFADPQLRLPAGSYRIRAEVDYSAPDCGEPHRTLKASFDITVQ